jgi:hypothetical protein
MKSYFENDYPSPDENENPFEKKDYFFLVMAERPKEAPAVT